MSDFNGLVTRLVARKEDIKDYYFMVQQLGDIGSQCYDFQTDDELDDDQKWKSISDMLKTFGYTSRNYSPTKCRDRFLQWSSFYAKNYDKLNGILEPNNQKIFDLLKIVHILELNKIWIFDNPTHSRLRVIAKKSEIIEYLLAYNMRRLKLNDVKQNNLKTQFNRNTKKFLTFEEMNLCDDLLRGLRDLGYHKPSSVQQSAIVAAIEGRDVIAQAQSGTGKTAAFAIAILQRIDVTLNECQALILAPTRELAQQIYKEIKLIGKHLRVRCHTSIGGYPTRKDARKLSAGQHIVIGTPGRVLHMIEDNYLKTDWIKMFVLDESDQLLGMIGFKGKILDIFREFESSIQIFLSSATMPSVVLQMSRTLMKNPVTLLVKDEELTLEGLQQYFVMVGPENNKFSKFVEIYSKIREIIDSNKSNKIQAFIYCNTRKRVDMLAQMLEHYQIELAYMHGYTPQREREWILNDFRKGYSRFLITTDLLGRGIDVKEVELVINFDLPEQRETYMHRVGRSGRFGRTGKAINFITEIESQKIQEIAQFYNTQIDELPVNWPSLF